MRAIERPGMPRSCDDCEAMMEGTDRPGSCAHPEGCPFERLDGQTIDTYSFAMTALDSWEENTGPGNSIKTKKYGVNLEKFDLACRIDGVAQEDQREALQLCGRVATWAMETQTWKARQARERRRK